MTYHRRICDSVLNDVCVATDIQVFSTPPLQGLTIEVSCDPGRCPGLTYLGLSGLLLSILDQYQIQRIWHYTRSIRPKSLFRSIIACSS